MTPLVLGVDGGGTKTHLALADAEGRVHWQAVGPGIGPMETAHWPEVLRVLMQPAQRFAPQIRRAVFALPSHGEIAAVSRAQEAEVAALAALPHRVVNDVQAAFEGAFLGEAGALLLAGTGSMVWAADAAGRQVRVGGWGHGYGDEGSAFWIGRAAVALLSHAFDGRAEEDALTRALQDHLRLAQPRRAEALAEWFHADADPRVRVAALAAFVDARADAGDAAAVAILAEAADHLAAHLHAAWRRLPSLPAGVWSFAGSVARSRILRQHLCERVMSPPCPPAMPPVGGALWRAATEAGWAVDAAWIAGLRLAFPLHP